MIETNRKSDKYPDQASDLSTTPAQTDKSPLSFGETGDSDDPGITDTSTELDQQLPSVQPSPAVQPSPGDQPGGSPSTVATPGQPAFSGGRSDEVPGRLVACVPQAWSSAEERRKFIGCEGQKVVDLQGRSFVRSLDLLILRKYPRRIVTSARYCGLVCSAVGRDETGIVGIVLWGEQVNLVKSGDVVRINNGWCREQNRELVVSTGRSGSLTIVES